MKIKGKHYRTIWEVEGRGVHIQIIDQRSLPHQLIIETLSSVKDVERAIREMHLRGAPLIGAAAAYGVFFALQEALQSGDFKGQFDQLIAQIQKTRPTAVDLFNCVERCKKVIFSTSNTQERLEKALKEARQIVEESVLHCESIGQHGLSIIQDLAKTKKEGEPVNILTHCNAGWLACIDHGTATAPIYAAHKQGIPIHVWVDETRPRNQGARLTAYELLQEGIPHTVISDNTGGLLMQKKRVDLVLVGSDRTTREGDVANKIGTYLKALAAHDNQIPFYVALPASSFDWTLRNGLLEIPIEERSGQEVKYIQGINKAGNLDRVLLCPPESPALNYGFDITPARYVTGLITERGICAAHEKAILSLYPEKQ